ncbi:toprim domain-containing protein [Microbulbifer sp. 2201CG32-9]|uniref:toprim domain-containing protein n=1 Tax=Microbulbifer sp. 2201CG32-9 TaxID=3232309 RepID=UPI00345B9C15
MDYSQINRDVVAALERDQAFQFKRRGDYFQAGICPGCGKKQAWTSAVTPIVVRCNRKNNCGYEESVRDLYPDLFENFSKHYPATPEEPNATARAYMDHVRQFPHSKIGGWFEQGARPLPGGGYAPTVRFDLGDGYYWERVINKNDERELGDKAFFKSGYRYSDGKSWQPPGQTLKSNDVVYIVEGIFHAIALWLCGLKAVAAFSSNNLPRQVIEAYRGQSITWRLAYDNDPAGERMGRYHEQLQEQGEVAEVCLVSGSEDWDDLYRLDKITPQFIEDCLYRGRLFTAKSIEEKAYHWYCKRRRSYTVLDFGSRLYSVHVEDSLARSLSEAIEELNQADIEDSGKDKEAISTIEAVLATERGRELFDRNLNTTSISNCLPRFLYCEINKENLEVAYYFNIAVPRGKGLQVAFTGSHLESPKSFNKALLNQAPGSTFDGSEQQLKLLRDRWFDSGVKTVETINFLGYERHCQVYVFQDFAFHNGRKLKRNRQGYFTAGKQRIKTSFKSFKHHHNTEFSPAWIEDFHAVFSNSGMVALSFWLGSLFAEQIRTELKAFPFLELTGEYGAGKSTVIEFLWKLCGRDDYEGFDPGKATFSNRTRNFVQVSNLPLVLIESDRSDKAKKGPFDFEELKTAYNGRSPRGTGARNNSNDTIEPPFRGSIVIAQNDTVDGSPALLSRIVHCHATKDHFSPATKPLVQRFERIPVEEASGFLPAVLHREKAILEKILCDYPALDAEYVHRGEIHDQRVVKNHAMVSAMVGVLPLVFPSLSEATVKDIQHYVYLRAVNRQGRLSADHPEVQKFWEIYDYLNVRLVDDSQAPAIYATDGGKVEAQTLNHSKDPAWIAINLIHYKQQCELAKVDHPDINSLKKLLPHSRRYKFHGRKNVKSAIDNDRARFCWVFENPDAKKRAD